MYYTIFRAKWKHVCRIFPHIFPLFSRLFDLLLTSLTPNAPTAADGLLVQALSAPSTALAAATVNVEIRRITVVFSVAVQVRARVDGVFLCEK